MDRYVVFGGLAVWRSQITTGRPMDHDSRSGRVRFFRKYFMPRAGIVIHGPGQRYSRSPHSQTANHDGPAHGTGVPLGACELFLKMRHTPRAGIVIHGQVRLDWRSGYAEILNHDRLLAVFQAIFYFVLGHSSPGGVPG